MHGGGDVRQAAKEVLGYHQEGVKGKMVEVRGAGEVAKVEEIYGLVDAAQRLAEFV